MSFWLHIRTILIIALIVSGLSPIGDPLTGIILIIFVIACSPVIMARYNWLNYPLSKWMLAYLAWLYIATYTSTVPSISMMTFAVLACLPVIYLALTNTPSLNNSWTTLSYIFLLLGTASAVLAIWQVYTHTSWAVGPLKDRNALAALMNLLWFPTVYLFLKDLKKTNKINTILLGIGIFLMSTALFSTISRGGIATWLLLQPLLIWSTFKHTQSKKISLLVPIICLSAFLSSSIILNNNVLDRNLSFPTKLSVELNNKNGISNSHDKSTLLRVMLLKSTMEIALDNPVFGTGWGTFPNHYPAYRDKDENYSPILYTHNDYLQLASEGGFVTPIILIGILIGLIKLLIKNLKRIENEAAFESVLLLLGALSVFIHANLNFVFYYTFMGAIAGLYLARASLLTQQPKTISLENLLLFRPYARNLVAGFIILIIALPFVARQISMSTLSGNQVGLRIINIILPNMTASSIANFITVIYPKEQIAQEFTLLEIEQTLANSNFNDSTHFEIKSQYLIDAVERFDFVRASTANNPDIGAREANILIKHHTFFDNGLAFAKASKVLDDNLKVVPYHPDTYIMLSRLAAAKGDSTKAIEILRNAEQKMINQLDHRLVYSEILRQQSAPAEVEELSKLQKEIGQVRIYLNAGRRDLIPKNFGPNLDIKLSAIEKRITTR